MLANPTVNQKVGTICPEHLILVLLFVAFIIMRTLTNFWTGDVNEATYKVRDSDYFLWEANSNRGGSSFSRSTGGWEQAHSGTDSTRPNREDSQIFNFAAMPNSSPSKASWNTSQQVQHGNQLDYLKHVDISRNMENQIMEKKTSIKSVMVMRCSRIATKKTPLMTTMAPKDQVDKSKNM
jgi:hypothetical protein